MTRMYRPVSIDTGTRMYSPIGEIHTYDGVV